MFERFTRTAREAVVQAQVRARELGHATIGPEHLLLGVLDVADGAVAAVLREEGVDPASVRKALHARDQAAARADAEALREIGIDLAAVRERAEAAFGPSALRGDPPARRGLLGRFTGPHLPFGRDARQALVLALREALALHHDRIGTEHVLLGLLQLDGDPVGPLLGTTDSARVRAGVITALSPAV